MTKARRGLPVGWELKSLRDVADVHSAPVQPVAGRMYRCIGLEHVEAETGAILAVPEIDGARIGSVKHSFDVEHLLYGKLRPKLNKVALPNFSGVCSTDLVPLAPKATVSREYIAYYLRRPSFVQWAATTASGTKMPRLSVRRLMTVAIPIPPRLEQDRIVAILELADGMRRKRIRSLELAESVLSASFVEMFGDPATSAARFPRESLGDLAEVKAGATKGRRFGARSTVTVPYLRVANVQDGYLDLEEVKEIEVLPEDRERYRLEPGDVLMTEGGDPDKLGRGCVWRGEVSGCIHQNHVFRVRSDRKRLLPEYLAGLQRTSYSRQYFLSCAKRSSNLASVNARQVKAFPVPVPPLALQRKFVMAVEQWERSAERLKAAQRVADASFASLLQGAFEGTVGASGEAPMGGAEDQPPTKRDEPPPRAAAGSVPR